MDLKSILPKSTSKDYFWALVLEPDWVQAGIWTPEEGKASVVSVSPPVAWSKDEELIDACDTALSAAVQNLPDDKAEPSKVVFGLPASWISDGQISSEYIGKIKKICSELSLTPVGFVVLAEAISYFKKSGEGSPLTAIIVGIQTLAIEISYFKEGVVAATTTVSRSVSVVEDLIEGLSRFSGEDSFASRIILYNGKEGELEDARQTILDAPWSADNEKVRFLHTPKVEILNPDDKILATSLAGGAELANTKAIAYEKPTESPPGGEDEEKDTQEHENVFKPKENNMGFVIGEDIKKASSEILETEIAPPSDLQADTQSPNNVPVNMPSPSANKSLFNLSLLTNIFKRFKWPSLPFRVKKSDSPAGSSPKKLLVMGGIFLVVLIVGAFVYWWFVPKAEVTIYISPQKLEEKSNVEVTIGGGSVDLGKKILPAKSVSKPVSGEKTKDASGTKLVGDKASGEIIIYRSGPEITLPKGTVVKSSDGLSFSINEDAKVASGSASTPGTTKVKITASDIGSSSNLAAGSHFSVGNFSTSDIEAKNESAFTGGSSREINAVAAEDEETLLDELTQELKEKASMAIKDGLNEGEILIDESLKESVTEKTFSAKVGDEASTLKLSLSLEVKAAVVKKEDLLALAKEALKNRVASGFVLRDDQIKISFEFGEENDGIYKLEARYTANLLPQIDEAEIAKKIAGRYPKLAEEYLSSIEGFDRAEITMDPKLPGKLGTLPRIPKRILIEFASAK